jgi:hypothetical protein
MGAVAEGLPQRQSWVGEVKYLGAILTVTLMLYGEAALAVTCRHLLSEPSRGERQEKSGKVLITGEVVHVCRRPYHGQTRIFDSNERSLSTLAATN